MVILIGGGVFYAVEVPSEPKSGDVLNLGDDRMLTKGQYRVTREGSRTWGTEKKEYPYYQYGERVGKIPEGEQPLEMALLSI